jgi:hypothetical protein
MKTAIKRVAATLLSATLMSCSSMPQQHYIPQTANGQSITDISKDDNLLVLSGFTKSVLISNSPTLVKNALLSADEVSYAEINDSVKRQLQLLGYKHIETQTLDNADTLISGNNLTLLTKQQTQLSTAPTLTTIAQQSLTAAIKDKKADTILLITPQPNAPASIQIDCLNKTHGQATLYARMYIIDAQTFQVQSYADTTPSYNMVSAETICGGFDAVSSNELDILLEPQMAKFDTQLGETVTSLL